MEDQVREELDKSIEDAAQKGLMRVAEARPPIKQQVNTPKIAICIPMGDKDDPSLFTCPHCTHRHFGKVLCPKCEKEDEGIQRVRHAGLAPIEFLLNAMQIVPPLLCSMVFMARKSVLSAQARQEMTYEAIKLGCKYIFYWDDDTIIPPKAIYELHNMMERTPDAGIITGVYTTREQCPEPVLYKNHGQGSYWGFSMKPGVLEPVFGAGAGCMMARVEALEDVERILGGPWWADEHDFSKMTDAGVGTRIIWGHDIRFCRRIHETREKYRATVRTEPLPQTTLEAAEEKELEYTTITEVAEDSPKLPWQVYVAGWIQCYHFDIHSQTMFGLPADSPPMQNANTASYWDHLFKMEGQASSRINPAIFNRVAELIPEGSKVVDIGCGIGILLDMLTKKKRIYGYGIDFSERAIELLQSRWLEGEVQDIRNLSLNHFPHDEVIAVCTETIEHLDDERLAGLLTETQKCKMAIFSTPDGPLPGTPEGEHVREFTSESLDTLLKGQWEEVAIEKAGEHHLLAVCSKRKET